MNSQRSKRAYVLIEIQPGKENQFKEEIMSKHVLTDPKEERIDLVHGIFDYVIILFGQVKDIDRRIIEIRSSPYIARTETLL